MAPGVIQFGGGVLPPTTRSIHLMAKSITTLQQAIESTRRQLIKTRRPEPLHQRDRALLRSHLHWRHDVIDDPYNKYKIEEGDLWQSPVHRRTRKPSGINR